MITLLPVLNFTPLLDLLLSTWASAHTVQTWEHTLKHYQKGNKAWGILLQPILKNQRYIPKMETAWHLENVSSEALWGNCVASSESLRPCGTQFSQLENGISITNLTGLPWGPKMTFMCSTEHSDWWQAGGVVITAMTFTGKDSHTKWYSHSHYCFGWKN